jgi:hypothetical protein
MTSHASLQTALGAIAILFSAALNHHAHAGTFQNGEFITRSQNSWGDLSSNAGTLLVNGFNPIDIAAAIGPIRCLTWEEKRDWEKTSFSDWTC